MFTQSFYFFFWYTTSSRKKKGWIRIIIGKILNEGEGVSN